MSYTAPSIEMSPIESTLERRATGLRSADIGYDEERAETNSRARVGRTSTRIASHKTLETLRVTDAVQIPLTGFSFAESSLICV